MTTACRFDSSSVRRLAKRLEQDVRMRGLCAGDRYLTAAEAARQFGTSVTAAHHALKLLADQQLLLRRRNSGTFVGPKAAASKASKIRTVHVLMPADHCITMARSDLLMRGILSQIGDASVQFNFLPDRDTVAYVRELISMANAAGEVAGIVAIRCPREVYRLLAESRLPTVVFGSLFPGEPVLPSINTDERETGRLLTQYLIDRGHRRMALLTGAEGWPGDNDFFDGVSQALTTARLPHDALLIRIIPYEERVYWATTQQLLAMSDPPDGFITRERVLVDVIARAAEEAGRKASKSTAKASAAVEIVFQEFATTEAEQSPYVHVRPQLLLEDAAAVIGKMLRAVSENRPLESDRIVLPVELRVPSQKEAQR